MSLTSELSPDGVVTIKITGNFDFGVHNSFRDAYEGKEESVSYVIDLSEADFIDSSALGMLLLLREHAGNLSERVVIRGAGDVIRKVLSNSKFDTLFKIE
ncbi:MAG: STAS domain-containing protein [Gammaproteobacteria bacterium]|nr:STAS domain-containing protein [Gammaproteobacteria bacterium]